MTCVLRCNASPYRENWMMPRVYVSLVSLIEGALDAGGAIVCSFTKDAILSFSLLLRKEVSAVAERTSHHIFVARDVGVSGGCRTFRDVCGG